MKKIIALLLAVMMCLSMVACNAGNSKYAKYMTIINALEAKDYEGAVEEIYQMYLEDEGMTEGTGTAENEENESSEVIAEVTAEVEMWLERAPGEYKHYNYDEEPLENIVLNADNTCTVEGKNYTWNLEKNWDGSAYNCGEDYVYVDILDGETEVYEMNLYTDEDGYIYASVYTVDAEGSINSLGGTFYNMNDILVVELTVDNWQDYFEEVEVISTSKNSFDEITSLNIYKYFLLKEEYGCVLTEFSDVAIEFTRTEVYQAITVDLENETYEWGEVTDTYDPYTSTTEMYNQWIDEESYYGFTSSSTYVDEFPEDEVYRYINFEMNRLKGTIYCVPVK